MKLKALVAAVALVAAGAANAAITPDQNGGSSLVFEAWDTVSNQGYVANLGKTLNQFYASPSTSFTNAISSTDLATLLGSDTSGANLNWHVFAVKTNPDLTSDDTVLSTIINQPSALLDQFSVGSLEQTIAIHITDIISAIGTANSGIIASSNTAYGGNVGTDYYGTLYGTSAKTGFGSLDFFSIENSQAAGNLVSTQRLQFSLSSDGTIQYGAPAAVPVPAAAWLFGSAVLGLIGVARRRFSV